MTTIHFVGKDQSLKKCLKSELSKKGIQINYFCETWEEQLKKYTNKKPPNIFICSSDLFRHNQNSPKKIISGLNQKCSILIILQTTSLDMIPLFMESNVRGVIHKDEIKKYLCTCITAIDKGGVFMTPRLKDFFLRNKFQKSLNDKNKALRKLTSREKKIAKLILDFKSNREISKELFISYQTVKNHRHQIMQKLELEGRGKLLQFLIENRENLNL